jgi:hypothetical protein
MPSAAKLAGFSDAQIAELIRHHLKPDARGLVSLYGLDTARKLMDDIGKDWADFGLDDKLDPAAYVDLYIAAWRDMAERIVMNGRRYGYDNADSLAKLEEAMSQVPGLTYSGLGTSRAEVEGFVKKPKGP